ncbi:MAG: RNA polymerase sporulation sigma factor SigK [Clostridia bacterium]|nr:RNA polymerase sporulation sigma factor SigK [Clostridia bacterium]
MGIFSLHFNFVYLFARVSSGGNFPPPLGAKRETELFEAMKKGDTEARSLLIEHNLRLVAHIIKKYYGEAKNQDDLMSIGTIGLIKAVDSFDPSNGTRFATYASKCLQNEILMHFRAQKKLAQEVSINDPIDVDKDGNPLTYFDIVYSEDTIAEDIDLKLKCRAALDIVRNELDERQRQIIVMRYGLNMRPAKTQREIAAELGISRSYVSRIEKSALEKIRSKMSMG